LAGQILFVLGRTVKQIHGQNHRVFVGLGFNGGNFAVISQLIKMQELERIFAVLVMGQELTISSGQKFDQKCLAVSRFTHQHEGHFLGRSALGGVLDIGNKAVDFVIHADHMLGSFAKDTEIICSFSVYNDFFDPTFQDHAGHPLKRVFKDAIALLDFGQVMVECF